jgi:alkylation response protein AidB-like acyl-CoA dehydrogenase
MIDPITSEFDANLSEAERELIDRARDFGRLVVAPSASTWEYDRCVPTEALRAACAEGLASMQLAAAVGGGGLRYGVKMRVSEELAGHDFAFAFSLVNHHNALVRIANARPAVAQRLVPSMLRGETLGATALTEPAHGSDLTGLETSAVKVAGGWRLNGAKAWVTNGAVAGVFITLVQTEPNSGAKGLATFVVEADEPGFIREKPYALHGSHAIGAGGFRLENYFAPDDALLDPPGDAFKRSLAGINGARCYVAAMCAGMLESAIGQAVRYTAERSAFGQAVLDFQGLRWSLVDAQTDLAALRQLTYRAARKIDAGENAEEAAAMAKKFAGDSTLPHIAACIQAMGANGLRDDHPLMRHLAGCKTACFTDGSTEMMNERLGKLMLRQYVSPPTPGQA